MQSRPLNRSYLRDLICLLDRTAAASGERRQRVQSSSLDLVLTFSAVRVAIILSCEGNILGFDDNHAILMERFDMTSRSPYWCSKTMKGGRVPVPNKSVLWELNSKMLAT